MIEDSVNKILKGKEKTEKTEETRRGRRMNRFAYGDRTNL